MIGGLVELFANQGRTFSYNISLNQTSNNSGYDLTNGTIIGYIKKSYYSTIIAAQFKINIIDVNNGIINLELLPSDTVNLFPQRYVFDIVINYPGNVSYPLLNGIIYIEPSVTI